jgi:transposase-like protein
MKDQSEKEEITLAKLAAEYSDETKARALFERLRWPNGPQCPYCSAKEPYKLKLKPIKNRPARDGMYKCRECRKQFTATKGTILESSHIPIQKWLMAFSLIASSKKSVSAHQMHRSLGIDYKSAWFMCHRIRHAVKYIAQSHWPILVQATIEADGLPTSTGTLEIADENASLYHYRPIAQSNLRTYPSHQARLKVAGISETLRVQSIQPCLTGSKKVPEDDWHVKPYED